MKALIERRFETDEYLIYLGHKHATGRLYFYQDEGKVKIQQLNDGEGALPFIRLQLEHYEAIRDAIILAEGPKLGDSGLLREAWDDSREVRDRLLTLLEES